MTEDWEVPDTLWCAEIGANEHHFDEATYKELVNWLDSIRDMIIDTDEKYKFDRFHTETLYGEEITFGFIDVRSTFISTFESRRRSRISGESRRQEKLNQGFSEE